MTRTHSIESFLIPEKIPGEATITMANSVIGISTSDNYDEIIKMGNTISVVVGPTWFSSPQKQRKLWLDHDKNFKPEFPSIIAGELDIEDKTVFIFLEKE